MNAITTCPLPGGISGMHAFNKAAVLLGIYVNRARYDELFGKGAPHCNRFRAIHWNQDVIGSTGESPETCVSDSTGEAVGEEPDERARRARTWDTEYAVRCHRDELVALLLLAV